MEIAIIDAVDVYACIKVDLARGAVVDYSNVDVYSID